ACVADQSIAMLIERKRGVQRVHRKKGREFFASAVDLQIRMTINYAMPGPQLGSAGPRETGMSSDTANQSKCPFSAGTRGRGNRDWWPDALDVSVLHRNSNLSDPLDYAKEELKSLDLNALTKDLHAVTP